MPFSRTSSSGTPDRRRGAALVLLTFILLLVVIPLVGLAIDLTTLYLVRARLSQAVDAGALAGARSLSTGLDINAQIANATNTATSYVRANFPDGLMGTSNIVITPLVQQTPNSSRTVTVTASVTAPTYLMRVLHYQFSIVGASAQATRRDVNLILVLDRSSSMAAAGVCNTMVANAEIFVNKFADGRDQLGLITFMVGANVDYPSTLNFKQAPALTSTLSQLKCGGNTGSAEALWLAYGQIKAINQPGRLNVIVFFTDGLPNGITAWSNPEAPGSAPFPIKTQADTRWTSASSGSQSAAPKSGCQAGDLLAGAIAQTGGGAATGSTAGVFNLSISPAISNINQPAIAAPGCAFPANEAKMSYDVAAIPNMDAYGNATQGYKTIPSDFFPAGNPYAGLLRPDTPYSIAHASLNAADDAATRIRSDTNFSIVIFTLGLGGTSAEGLDDDFLRRVANDPGSTIYNPNRPTGMYVLATDYTQLTTAFNTIASQVLRLSR